MQKLAAGVLVVLWLTQIAYAQSNLSLELAGGRFVRIGRLHCIATVHRRLRGERQPVGTARNSRPGRHSRSIGHHVNRAGHILSGASAALRADLDRDHDGRR